MFECLDEGWAAIGISRIIHSVHTAPDVSGAEHFGPAQRYGKHDGVACRHVGHRNAFAALLRYLDVRSKRGATDAAQVHVYGLVFDRAEHMRDTCCRIQLGTVALT